MTIRFNADLIKRDAAALRGWSPLKLARKSRVSAQTLSRFFRGGSIRPETAQKLATAIGQPLEKYVIEEPEPAVSR